METTHNEQSNVKEFPVGAEVVYGIHGRCSVVGIETKEIGGQKIRFYKLQLVKKSPIARPTSKAEPAIWLPTSSAGVKGLRKPMDKSEADAVIGILENQEYYFNTDDKWPVVQKQLEDTLSNEGPIGLAKVMSYLFVMKNKQIVPDKEVIRFSEMIHKQLVRELAEIMEESIRATEDNVAKMMKNKLKPDQ